MSQNLLPVEDLSEEAAPLEGDAQNLHLRLENAFAPQKDGQTLGAIEAARALAAATLQQGQFFDNFQERIVRLEHGPDVGAIRENVRDLCEALLHITVENKNTSADIDNRFESLSDAMAAISGHMASQRRDIQANIAAANQLSEQLEQLQGEIAAGRAEAVEMKDLILSTGQALRSDLEVQGQRLGVLEDRIVRLTDRVDDLEPSAASLANRMDDLQSAEVSLTGRLDDLEPLKDTVVQLAAGDAKLMDRIGQVADDLDMAKNQLTGLEDAASALADSSIRASEGLSVLGTALETAKTQIFSLNETSEYLTDRLRIAEQVVENFSRREKILAGLHARAARALQTGR